MRLIYYTQTVLITKSSIIGKWDTASQMLEKGFPESAIIVYNSIHKTARENTDYGQMLKAFNATIKSQLLKNWKYRDSINTYITNISQHFPAVLGRILYILNLYELSNKYYYVNNNIQNEEYIISNLDYLRNISAAGYNIIISGNNNYLNEELLPSKSLAEYAIRFIL